MNALLEKLFRLEENKTNVMTECVAGLTTFCSLAYVIFVIPAMLGVTSTPDNPLPHTAVFIAVLVASAIATLVMAFYANVPYALAPGLGLSSFFAYTICTVMGFTWQEGLAMVFLCSIISIFITVTNIRKMIIAAIPESLQIAMGGGIGLFISYVGIKNAGLLNFTLAEGSYTINSAGTVIGNSSCVPTLAPFNTPELLMSVFGIIMLYILLVRKVKFAILWSIFITTIACMFAGLVDLSPIEFGEVGVFKSLDDLKYTFGAALGSQGIGSLLADSARYPMVFMMVFSFSLTDIFDTLGMLLGTGRQTGIFTDEEMAMIHQPGRPQTKLEKALFADVTGTCTGAIFGCTNITVYLESNAGIQCGGRTGLTSVVTAIFMLSCIVFAPIVERVPGQATAPVLILVGISMLTSFKEIEWGLLEEAAPAFFAGVFMALCYNISYGIAISFIVFCLTKLLQGRNSEIHPILWICTVLFVLNFVAQAMVT